MDIIEITCPNCQTKGRIPREKLAPEIKIARCRKCGHAIPLIHILNPDRVDEMPPVNMILEKESKPTFTPIINEMKDTSGDASFRRMFILLCIICFFLPALNISLPIVGSMRYTPYRMASMILSTDSSNISKSDKATKEFVTDSKKSYSNNKGATLMLMAILMMAVAHIGLLIQASLALLYGLLWIIWRSESFILLIVSSALAVQYAPLCYMGGSLFVASLKSEASAGTENAFPGLLDAMFSTVNIEPAYGAWVLFASGAAMLYVAKGGRIAAE